MNFNEFTDRIVKLLQQETGENHTVTVKKVLKNNDVLLTGIIITEKSENVSPTIYLEEPYRRYQDGVSLQAIVAQIMELYEKHVRNIRLDMGFFKEFDLVKDRIFHKLVNFEKNKEMLRDVPYFRWHDLAVTFYYSLEDASIGRASVVIYNSHLEMWGQSAEEVYRIARDNMKRRMPELLIPMRKLLEESIEMGVEECSTCLHVLTNRAKLFGASAMLYSEKIRELADRWNSDLLILPSSVHEVLLVPDDQSRNYDFYRKMVREVNITQVDPEEILSDALYRYNREKEEIEEITV